MSRIRLIDEAGNSLSTKQWACRTIPAFACLLLFVGCTVSHEGITFNWPVAPVVNPVDPAPHPDVKPDEPVTVHEFRCLVLHDPSKSFTPQQQSMLYSSNTREFMKANAVKDGETPAYRIVDGTDDGVTYLTGVWKRMFDENHPKSLPWVIMTNEAGKPISEPLPSDWAQWKAKLEQASGVMP